jgi:GTPase SAR1 family protein
MVVDTEMTPSSGGTAATGMQYYAQMKDRVLKCIEASLTLEHVHGVDGEELREKLLSNTFNLVVVGQFKRGKTCLINALLGVDLLPVAVVPLTSIVTILVFGETQNLRVFFNDGRMEEISSASLVDYVTETGNPKNLKEVGEVVISYPSRYLQDGVRLIDTPGVGSIYLHNTGVAYQYLPKSDAALFLLSVEQPASQAELDFLRDVRQFSHRIFFLLNKIDYLNENDREQSIDFSQQVITEAMGMDVKIFPISAKLALEGKLTGSAELLQASQLPAFAEVLHQFLLHDKGKVLLLSVTDHLLRGLAQGRLQAEMEMKALTTSLDALTDRVAAFERKRQEMQEDKQNFSALLSSELARLVKNGLEVDLAAFKKDLVRQMEAGFEAFYQEHQGMELRELNEALETYVSSEVQQAIYAWRVMEEDRISTKFAAICNHFTKNVNDAIDALLTFSSELFELSFEPTKVEPLWTAESNYYYKMKSEPVALEMLANSVTLALPKMIGDRFRKLKLYLSNLATRIISGKVKQHMLETIDLQSGRLRYDFVERLDKSQRGFRTTMLQKMDTAIAGVTSAIEKGMELRSQGEPAVAARQALLVEELRRMQELRAEVLAIGEAAAHLGN